MPYGPLLWTTSSGPNIPRDMWKAEIVDGAISGDVRYHEGTGEITTGIEYITGAAAASYDGDTWIHVMDRDESTDAHVLRRMKIDGTGLENIADMEAAIGVDLDGACEMCVDSSNGDTWVIILFGDSQVRVYRVTLAGVVTQKLVLPATGNVGFGIQINKNGILAIARMTEDGPPSQPFARINTYDSSTMTGIDEFDSDWEGNSYGGIPYGPPFLLTDDSLIFSTDYYATVKIDLDTGLPTGPNPHMDFGVEFVPLKMFRYGDADEVYAIGYDDFTVDPQIRLLEGDGGVGTVVTGWTDTDGWFFSVTVPDDITDPVPGPGEAVLYKVEIGGEEEVEVDLISLTNLERALEREDGGFRIGNLSAVVANLPETYFDMEPDDVNSPYVFEITNDEGDVIFHGPISAPSIVRDEATGFFSFDALSWEALLAMVGSVPARSVYEANVLSTSIDDTMRVFFPIADVDFINIGDVFVSDADAGEIRETILNKGSLTGSHFWAEISVPPAKQLIEPFDSDDLVPGGFGGYFWFEVDTETSRFFMANFPSTTLSGDGEPRWLPVGGQKLAMQFYASGQIIESTRVLAIDYTETDVVNPIARVWLDPNDYDQTIWTGDIHGIGDPEFDQVAFKFTPGVVPGSKAKILGGDLYGYVPAEPRTPFFMPAALGAMLLLGEDNAPTESFGRPLGILPNIVDLAGGNPTGLNYARIDFDRGIELPEKPIEALRLIQRSMEAYTKWVPKLSVGGMPQVDVQLIPREAIEDGAPLDLSKVIRSWSTRVAPEKIAAVVVRANEEYRKPAGNTDYVGVWWVTTDGLNPDTVNPEQLRYLTLPQGQGVMEIEVAVPPAYVAERVFLGGGKPIANDNVLKAIAESAYNYFAKAGQRFSALLAVEYTEDLLAERIGVNESGFDRTAFITQTSAVIKDNAFQMAVEGILEPVHTATTLRDPIAIISGIFNYNDSGSGATVRLEGSRSHAPDGQAVGYEWRRRERSGGTWGAWSAVLETTVNISETLSAGLYEYELRVFHSGGTYEGFAYEVVSISELSAPPA